MLSAGEVDQAKEKGRTPMRMVLGLLPIAAMVSGATSEIVTLFFRQSFEPAAPLFALLILGALAFCHDLCLDNDCDRSPSPRWTPLLSAPLVLLAMAGYWIMLQRLGHLAQHL